MKLLGNRIYLKLPKQEDTKVIVDENTREALNEAFKLKMLRSEVHSIGDTISSVKVGDLILVDPQALQKAPIIPLSENENVLLVSPFDVIMIW